MQHYPSALEHNIPKSIYINKCCDAALFYLEHGGFLEKAEALQEILEDACSKGDLKTLLWLAEKQREMGIPTTLLKLFEPLQHAVRGGFDDLAQHLSLWLGLSSIDQQQRESLLELSLEAGYPNLFHFFHQHGFIASQEQLLSCAALTEALSALIVASPPLPMTPRERLNKSIDPREYQTAVAYALYYLRQENCNFQHLIENLGCRMRRMAALAGFSGLDLYGISTTCQMQAPIHKLYDVQGKKVRRKYNLYHEPRQVVTAIDGKQIPLTLMTYDAWIYPAGEHRTELLTQIEQLCQKLKFSVYSPLDDTALLYDLGKLTWLISQAPPFLRGSSDILSISIDAFLLYHGRSPLPKTIDLSREALVYDSDEEFALYFAQLLADGGNVAHYKAFQEHLIEACDKGDLPSLLWLFKNEPCSQFSLFKPLQRAVLGGYDAIVDLLSQQFDISSLPDEEKRQMIELTLEVGYPSLFLFFQKCDFPITTKQRLEFEALEKALSREITALPPPPINQEHDKTHGGRSNAAIYQKEYQLSVAYALYYMKRKECNFRTLIENLGHRRRRMAGLGGLDDMDWYGVPTTHSMKTFFLGPYQIYGQRIQERYSSRQFPLQVMVNINGKEISLTRIERDAWHHPSGEFRDEILGQLDILCRRIKSIDNPTQGQGTFVYDLGKIVWLLSHAPPFLRGTPTIISILVDAFSLYHGQPLLDKTPDINCEALTYDNDDAFAQYLETRRAESSR